MEYYLIFKKEGNPVIGNSMGEPGGHYAMCDKLVIGRQVL